MTPSLHSSDQTDEAVVGAGITDLECTRSDTGSFDHTEGQLRWVDLEAARRKVDAFAEQTNGDFRFILVVGTDDEERFNWTL